MKNYKIQENCYLTITIKGFNILLSRTNGKLEEVINKKIRRL
jgi:hypothetical protein